MLDTDKVTALIEGIEAQKKIIGEARDKLRELLSDVEGILESSERAQEFLEGAADALSELL